jgi:hypothetical protein
LIQLLRSPRQIILADDRISPIHFLRLMPNHFHRDAPGNAGPLQVPDRRATQIMEDASGTARLPTGGPPRLAKRLDAGAIGPVKHPRGQNPVALQRPRDLALSEQHRLQLQGEREHSALTALRRAWIETHGSADEIDPTPFEPRNLAEAPACDVAERHHRAIECREMGADGLELIGLEESGPGRAFFQPRDIRLV